MGPRRELSHWEHASLARFDALVVGGGVVGLSTAIEFAERRPKWRIGLLERGLFPSGASSRNAGFACFGSLTEVLGDAERLGRTAALEVLEHRRHGLALLRTRFSDAALGYEACGGWELILPAERAALERLDEANAWLSTLFAEPVYRRGESALGRFGFAPDRLAGLVECPHEGVLDTGRMLASLVSLAQQRGVVLHTGAEVRALRSTPQGVHLEVASHGEACELRAECVALCTNALLPELAPELEIQPGRGQVLLTEPLPGLHLRGAFHFDAGYYYFRHLDTPEGSRILFGGGRNLDLLGETRADFGLHGGIQAELERQLATLILPGCEPRIARRWSGVMGFSADKRPIVARHGERVAIGFGCNGMGVALCSWIAERTAALLT